MTFSCFIPNSLELRVGWFSDAANQSCFVTKTSGFVSLQKPNYFFVSVEVAWIPQNLQNRNQDLRVTNQKCQQECSWSRISKKWVRHDRGTFIQPNIEFLLRFSKRFPHYNRSINQFRQLTRNITFMKNKLSTWLPKKPSKTFQQTEKQRSQNILETQ